MSQSSTSVPKEALGERTLASITARAASSAPESSALVAPGYEGALTYDRLHREVTAVADALAALGLRREDRVAVVLPNGPEMIVAFLGVSAAAVCAPLNPTYRAAELAFYMDDIRAAALLLRAGDPSPAREVAKERGIPVVEIAASKGAPPGVFSVRGEAIRPAEPRVPPKDDDVALILHTSGTTARPKIVPILHRNLFASAHSVAATLRLTPEDRCLNVMPMFHIHSLVAASLAPLASGGSIVCAPGFVATEFFDWVSAFQPTWYTAVPTIHRGVLQRSGDHPDVLAAHRLRFIRSSSSPLSPDVMEALEKTFGVPVIEAYGMTEAAHQMASNPLPPKARKPGSVGLSAGAEIAILKDDGQFAETGERGEIVIRGPGVIQGYHDNPEANEKSFFEGWFRTGDEGYLDEDKYLFISGRTKEIINRAGEKIAPREVDEVLLQHPAIQEATCFALPHPTLGEEVAAAVVVRAGFTVSDAEIREFSAARLALFKVPTRIVVVPVIPKSSVGKPQRIGLHLKLGLQPSPAESTEKAEFVAPGTPLEKALASVWTDVLRAKRVGLHDRFLDLGGDSILAARVASRLRDVADVRLPLTAFFDQPTIAAQAALLAPSVTPEQIEKMASGAGSASSIPVLPRGGDLPLSSVQESIWLADLVEDNGLSHLRNANLRLSGPVDAAALTKALHALLNRHEILRASFPDVGGTPVVRIQPLSDFHLPHTVLDQGSPEERAAKALALAAEEARRPLDIRRGPVCRFALVSASETDHHLLATFHHIVFDAWSAGLFAEELSAHYAAVTGASPAPAELQIQVSDFAAYQRSRAATEALREHVDYWRGKLAGLRPVLDLPFDRPRPARPTFGGGRHPITLSRARAEALREVGRPEGATLFMVLLAAYELLLARYSGESDIGVVCTIADRPLPAVEKLLGVFINLLVCRAEVSGTATFQKLLAEVRRATLEAYEHKDLPFDRLVAELNPERSAGHRPLSQVSFTLHNVPFAPVTSAGVTFAQAPVHNGTSQFDLNLLLDEGPDGLTGWLEYSTDLFDAATIARLAGSFDVLLGAIAESPSAPCADLPILSAEDRETLLVRWNDTARSWPDERLFHERFEAHARETPDAVAVVSGEEKVSYRELNERANRLARRLRTMGVGPGSLVALYVERSPEMMVGLLGVLKAGGAYVPLDPEYPTDRVAFMLDDAQPAAILTQAHLATSLHLAVSLAEVESPVIRLDADAPSLNTEASDDLSRGALTPDDLAYVIYTSGSTGRPKGAMNAHRGALNRLLWMQRAHGLGPSDRVLQKTPYSFDVSVWELFWPLVEGARLVFAKPGGHRDPAYLVSLIQSEGITTLHFVPSMLGAFLDEPGVEGCSSIARVFASGEALTPDLVKRYHARLSAPLVNLYGPTEAAVDVTEHRCSPGETVVPIGRPIDNVQIYVLDERMSPVPVGVRGELYIGGVQVGRGYLNQPALTNERFVKDPFSSDSEARLYRTGDVARHLPSGEVEYLGRTDFQVKIRGFRIELGEIEAAIRRHPSVRDVVVTAREDVPGDKRLVAYIVPASAEGQEQAPSLSAAELRSALKSRLPDHMVPAAFVTLPALPLTSSGKIDRRALPAPNEGARRGAEIVAPRTATEELLVGLWTELLCVERISVEDDFFALGGHSLLGTRLLARLRATLGVELPLRVIFEAPTIAALARHVESARREGDMHAQAPIPRAPRGGRLPLSFAQQRLWFLDRLEPESTAYHIPGAIRLTGALDAEALRRAFEELIRRHESLRTTFVAEDGEPRQVVSDEVAFSLPLTDLGALSHREAEDEVQRLAIACVHERFDLERGPLFRARLVRLSEREHVLVFAMHHVISDGWSIGVLTSDLSAFYEAIRAGRPAALPELPVQYADHAVWQREWLSKEALSSQIAFWRDQLRGAPAAIDLPTDRPHPPVQSYRGAAERVELSPELTAAFSALCRSEGVTLFMGLLAAFGALLHRYSRQDDVVIGSPVAGRTRVETEGLVGCFVNTLLFRTWFSGDPTFRGLLARVRDVTLDAYAHQDVPFERIVEELSPARDLGRSPLFQVMLILQNTPAVAERLGDVEVTPVDVERTNAKFDLTLSLQSGPRGMEGFLEYATDLFDAPTVGSMVAHLRALIASAVATPARPVSEIAMMDEDERDTVLGLWNDTRRPFPEERVVHEMVEAQAARTPDRVAVVFEGESVSYRALDEQANRLADRLVALGAGPGSLVGVAVERSPRMVTGLLGVLKSGAAYVPLDPTDPAERLAYLLQDAGIALVVTDEETAPSLASLRARLVPIDDDEQAPSPSERARKVTPEERAYVVYTSDASGRPKGVSVPHRALVNTLYSSAARIGLSAEDALVSVSPLSFDCGGLEIFLPLAIGARVVIATADEAEDGRDLRALIDRAKATALHATPATWRSLVGAGFSPKADFKAICSGEVLPSDLAGALLRTGSRGVADGAGSASDSTSGRLRLFQMHGYPEAAVWSTCAEITGNEPRITIGLPLANTTTIVLDPRGEPSPLGVRGELYVGGAGVALGYSNRPELTAERFVADPFSSEGGRLFRTGDLVSRRNDGALVLHRRLDDQVKVRGRDVEPAEIEAALAEHPAVASCAVTVREDRPGDVRLVAYVVLAQGRALTATDVRKHLRARLPEHMIPQHVVEMSALPIAENGRVARAELPPPAGAIPTPKKRLPETPAERLLARVWCDVLDVERVHVTDNFFDLGGHSLLSLKVVASVRTQTGQPIDLRDLLLLPLEQIAAKLRIPS